jgi:hypothetical protein
MEFIGHNQECTIYRALSRNFWFHDRNIVFQGACEIGLSPDFAPTQIRHSPTISFLSSVQAFRVLNELCGVNKSIEDKPVVFNLTLSQMKKDKNWEAQRATKSTMPVSRTREDLKALAASP